MGSWRNVERRGHKQRRKTRNAKSAPQRPRSVERDGIVNGSDAQKTHAEKERSQKRTSLPRNEIVQARLEQEEEGWKRNSEDER